MNYKEVLKCLKMPNYVSNDFYSMLFARSIGGTAGYDELTGTPPLTFNANGRNLINYRIYGANDGVGEQTENLFDKNATIDGYEITGSGISANANWYISDFIPVRPNVKYKAIAISNSVLLYKSKDDQSPMFRNGIVTSNGFLVPDGYNFIIVNAAKTVSKDVIMLTELSKFPAQYIPFGYQINAVVRSENLFDTDIPIYIGDTPLAQGEYVDYMAQKVYKYVGGVLTPTDPPVALPALPTIDGETIVDFDNTPKPSEMYIKYPK